MWTLKNAFQSRRNDFEEKKWHWNNIEKERETFDTGMRIIDNEFENQSKG